MDRAMPDSGNRRQLTVDVRRIGAGAVVSPAGELDHHSAGMLRESLDGCVADGCSRIVIDCSALEFCDSTGLNVLLTTRIDAEAAGGGVHLAAMRPVVARVFEITGAGAVFTVHSSLDDALAALPGS
ncbi:MULTISPECIES: STAS domain-containing protein [Streptomyces]|uniref:Anti-sigma factor antagonist n=3 Tax=Streptomyces TaxID=1883 RepID=A0A1I6W9Q8_9ACTN|nr:MULTISPECIES: STAS domain-containing protein [Streptomyces]MCK1813564.1 STAS domain-containing protein [Streptomyces sp. XM4011]QKV69365.1 STAS domain-containing protein [Streptomyces harbinensis]UWM49388.1 STAS domain-containing protein [Streptomyces carpaticus]SFT22725.1 anti-anti-sigma factor [Streptomyces harbinensis]